MTPLEAKTREYLRHLSSSEYLQAHGEKDPAVLRAVELKQELDRMRFEVMSDRTKFRTLVESEVAEVRAEEAKKAEADEASRP